jgi:hypothetical protein
MQKVIFGQAIGMGDVLRDAPWDVKLLYAQPFLRIMERALSYRCVFMTESGHLGVGPYSAQPGDIAAVLYGCGWCLVVQMAIISDLWEMRTFMV